MILRKTLNRINKYLCMALIAVQVLLLNGCILSNVDANLKTAPSIGSGVKIEDSVQEVRRRLPVQSVSHDMVRFRIDGENAFYIPEGLENDPASILSFKVLDYNSRGEFVYHLITPAYLTPEEVRAYKDDPAKRTGKAPTQGFTEPDRTDYSETDAELLMAYNPDTGEYRVLDARGYTLEWDPYTEERPSFYSSGIEMWNQDSCHIFMDKRGYAGALPGVEEYFLMDMSGICTVYDIDGNIVYSMSCATDVDFYRRKLQATAEEDIKNGYRNPSISPEEDEEYQRFLSSRETTLSSNEDTDGGSSDIYSETGYTGTGAGGGYTDTTMNLVMKDVEMSKNHYAFISCTAYTGDSPLSPDAWLGGVTFVSYRQNINREQGKSDYISYNQRVYDQVNSWMSLDNMYFPSKSAMESDPAYSMDMIKTGGSLKDDFTPFMYYPGFETRADYAEENSWINADSFIAGLHDFTTLNISGFSDAEIDSIIEDTEMNESEKETFRWYMTEYSDESSSDESNIFWRFTNFAGLSSSAREKLMDYWENHSTIAGHRAFRQVHARVINRILEESVSVSADSVSLLKELESNGLLPRMGDWDGRTNYIDLTHEAILPESFHLLKVNTDGSGRSTAFVTPIDTAFAESDPDHYVNSNYDHVQVAVNEYLPPMSRNVWYRDEKDSEELRNRYVREHPGNREDMEELVSLLSGFESGSDKRLIIGIYGFLSEGGKNASSDDESEEIRSELRKLKGDYEDFSTRLSEVRKYAKEERDAGNITSDEYDSILMQVKNAEKDYEDADDDEKKAIEDILFSMSIVSSVSAEKKENAGEELNDIIKNFPVNDQEYVISIAAGYALGENRIEENTIPLSYFMEFIEGAGTMVNRDIQKKGVHEGVLTGIEEGVLVAYDGSSENNLYSDVFGFSDSGSVFMDSNDTPGTPYEIGEFGYEDRSYLAYRTGYGVRFFAKDPEKNELFSPVEFSSATDEIKDYFSIESEDGAKHTYSESALTGFIPYEYLLTSSGYTKDTENRTEKAVEEILKDGEGESAAADSPALDESRNKRYTGSIFSADAVSMIGPQSVFICGLNSGTRILDIKSGEVAGGEETGSYYRLFKEKNGNGYRLIGFDNDRYSYRDYDIAMAKVYKKDYSKDSGGEIDSTLIKAVMERLFNMAKDYLYRQFRTGLDENGKVVIIEMPESETEENASAERLFNSGSGDDENGAFREELKKIEAEFGIEDDPEEILNYLYYLRKQAAAQKPAISRVYVLAGAASLATSEKREEAYFKNLDSRITMAATIPELEDRLVEIRMLPDAASAIPPEQAEKYEEYKKVLDYSAEQGEVTFDTPDMTVSANFEASREELEKKAEYRADVLSDIRAEFSELHPEEDFDETLESILNQVNPENLLIEKEGRADEFTDFINHGKSVLSGEPLERMKERISEALKETESVWELEKLIISEKVRQPGYESLRSAYEKYLEDEKAVEESERPASLRRTDFYKAIIGDLKGDTAVKEVLSSAKETWEDHLKDVLRNAGPGYVKGDDGLIEGSPYNDSIRKWRALSESSDEAAAS